MNKTELNRSFGYLVHDVARLLGNKFDQRARRLGLTRAQCKTLGYLVRNEGIHQAGLAELLEIAPITLVRLLDRMEEAGWIERRLDPADRRTRRLYLAARAKPVFSAVRRISDESRKEAFAGLAPEQQETLIDLLLQVHANLAGNLAGHLVPREAAGERPAAPPETDAMRQDKGLKIVR
jgi:MarR family transcriptional regulator, transcriptional regulator for hemolysin